MILCRLLDSTVCARLHNAPVCRFETSDGNAEALAFFHCDHLRRGLKAKLLHHGFEVVLARTLWESCWVRCTKYQGKKKNMIHSFTLYITAAKEFHDHGCVSRISVLQD